MKKRGRKPFEAINHIKDFNELKNALQKEEFTRDFFRSELKKLDIPCSNIFWSSLVKMHIIKRISKKTFGFTDSNPIYFERLDNAYKEYHRRRTRYVNTSVATKTRKKEEAIISEAVQLLKDRGYQIYAPVGELYSML